MLRTGREGNHRTDPESTEPDATFPMKLFFGAVIQKMEGRELSVSVELIAIKADKRKFF